MLLIGKHIDNVSESDILSLVEQKVSESVNLDYKQELPGRSDKDKKELLADVSSFANKSGGVIVFGISEKRDTSGKHTGIPKAVVGLKNYSENEQQRIEQTITSGLEPKLANCTFKSIKVRNKVTLLVGIPRSLAAPHMISFNRSGKFFIRNNSGKDQMNVDQIRESFLQTNEWRNQAKRFREIRIEQILKHDHVPGLRSTPSLVLHLLPLGDSRTDLSLNSFQSLLDTLSPPYVDSMRSRYNLDGYLLYQSSPNPISYVHFFRNLGIEVFDSSAGTFQVKFKKKILISGIRMQKIILSYFSRSLEIVRKLNVEPPFVLFISLLGVKDCYLCANANLVNYEGDLVTDRRIDRENVLVPPLMLTDWPDKDLHSLESTLDILWQAANFEEDILKKYWMPSVENFLNKPH
ncbi:MAG: ATP-binding protein [candidate division Zixibacteria bacterium]|nr:ATP-binding protein [candidate division Zixibacteria bacterium]